MDNIFSNALKRYLEIQALQKQLEEEKSQLRQIIDKELTETGHAVLVTDIGDTQVRIRKSERVKVSYDEDILRERLGKQYDSIVTLDMDKVKKNKQQLSSILGDNVRDFSSPDRMKIKELIENKVIDPLAFKGAFSKEVKNILYVTSKSKNVKDSFKEKPF